MSNTIRIAHVGDTMLAAPRQVWLATLGAAAVTRGWAGREAGTMFRALVKEGAAVESQALRRVGVQVDRSVRNARILVSRARDGVAKTVTSLAGAARTIVRTRLPAVRASLAVEAPAAPARVRKASKGGTSGATSSRARRARKAVTAK
jgi:hypothetical protein